MKKIFKYASFACALALAAILSGCQCNQTQTAVAPQKKEVSIQLYSFRKDMKTNPKGVIKKVGELGFTGVETADYKNGKFYGMTPQQFKAEVEKNGMKVVSSHVVKTISDAEIKSGDFSEALKWWDKAIADHKAAGMEYIVMAWSPFSKEEAHTKAYAKYFEQIGKKCAQQGLKFGYHQHALDMNGVDGKESKLEYILKNTDPRYVFIQLDTHNSVMGGRGAAEFLKKYPDRFELLHIKDSDVLGESGMVGFDAIFKYAKNGGVKGIIVEQESHGNNPYAEIKQSLDYLYNNDFVPAKW